MDNISNKIFHKQIPVSRFWKRWLYTIFFGIDYKGRKYTLLTILVLGLSGILIDLDHFGTLREITGWCRPLHLPYLAIMGIICISYHTYAIRRIHNSLLKEDEK